MARVTFSPAALAAIRDVLQFTAERFGDRKAEEYRQLIADARQRLAENPELGRRRPEIDPEARSLPISQRGRPARHLFLYPLLEQGQLVQVVNFLHDAMDLPSHWPQREKP